MEALVKRFCNVFLGAVFPTSSCRFPAWCRRRGASLRRVVCGWWVYLFLPQGPLRVRSRCVTAVFCVFWTCFSSHPGTHIKIPAGEKNTIFEIFLKFPKSGARFTFSMWRAPRSNFAVCADSLRPRRHQRPGGLISCCLVVARAHTRRPALGQCIHCEIGLACVAAILKLDSPIVQPF